MKSEVEETNIKGTRDAFKYVLSTLFGILITFQGMIYSEVKIMREEQARKNVEEARQDKDIEFLKKDVEAIKEEAKDRNSQINKITEFIKPEELQVKNQYYGSRRN